MRLSSKQRRIAERYRALCSSAATLRSLHVLSEECWVHASAGIEAAAAKIVEEIDAKADRIAERCPWVREWEPTPMEAMEADDARRPRRARDPLGGTRECEYCGQPTRITTAGCDHCDVEDK